VDNRPVIVFTIPDCMGGVTSFYRNIINHSSRSNNYRTRVILMNDEQDRRQKFDEKIIADEVIIFKHSYFENQRNVFKRLANVLGHENGCIVTDNALTLNVVKQIGSPKSIVYLVHDYYYINVALEYKHLIDACVVHSRFFKDVLLAADIDTFQHKAHYIPYGVEQVETNFIKNEDSDRLRLVFLGRWAESKGVLMLKDIDRQLVEKNVSADWTILGSGPLEQELRSQWTGSENVKFITAANTADVYKILQTQDILVFPSRFEGTPVAIMEAMSRGVVPVVSDLPGGTRDMVTDVTGFRCRPDFSEDFVRAITRLQEDRKLLKTMQRACLQKAYEEFDIKKSAGNYFAFFEKNCLTKAVHTGLKKFELNKLDNLLLPNGLVYRIRKLRSRM
jgi:glycosyltransferase involved in cell wall biosynthesis